MIAEKIMYVCEHCLTWNPECCAHLERRELRVLPDGKWVCEDCFDHELDHEEDVEWSGLPHPPEYGPKL